MFHDPRATSSGPVIDNELLQLTTGVKAAPTLLNVSPDSIERPAAVLIPRPRTQFSALMSGPGRTPRKHTRSVVHSDNLATPLPGSYHDTIESDELVPQPYEHSPESRNTLGRRRAQEGSGASTLGIYDGSVSPTVSTSIQGQRASIASTDNNFRTPVKQAYAGPTFHASPAASALPMPRFFSRSGPSDVPQSHLRKLMEAEIPPSTAQMTSPSRLQPPELAARQESPLDFFFMAHKAEQTSRKQIASPGVTNLQQPGVRSSAPVASWTTNTPGKDMFMMELDGSRDMHHTSYAAQTHTGSKLNRPGNPRSFSANNDDHEEQQRINKTQALRRMLQVQDESLNSPRQATTSADQWSNTPSTRFYTSGVPAGGTSNHQAARQHVLKDDLLQASRSHHRDHLPPNKNAYQRDAAVHQPQPFPVHPVEYTSDMERESRSSDVKSMEDSLRKILKLDSS